ncbi:hypothetical protein WDW86_08645 [Bdellovibrionota bacterium FG-2]
MTNRKLDHQFREPTRTDPYRDTRKAAGLATCKDCGAVCFRGRWVSEAEYQKHFELRPLEMHKATCPACLKLKYRYAQGVLELTGTQWLKSKNAILNTLRRSEQIFRKRNDQSRILWFGDNPKHREVADKFKIYVTLPELARHMGRQLQKTFKGLIHTSTSPEEPFVRVRWGAEQPIDLNRRRHTSRAFRKRGSSNA